VSLGRIANLVVVITLFEMMMAIGLGVSISDVARVLTSASLVTRAALANYIIVPAIALLLLFLFQAQPMVAAGLLLAAVCPGAPYAPPLTGFAKGNVSVSVGLMVLLAASSAFLAPLLLAVLLPVVARGSNVRIDVVKMVTTLLLTQLLPLAIGLLVRFKRPAIAEKLKKPANLLSGLLNIVMFTLIIALQYRTFSDIPAKGFVGMAALGILFLLVGWIFGGKQAEIRKSMGFATATRNVGVALVIATASFPGSPAVSSVLIYAIFQTIGLLLIALCIGRFSSAARAQ
jgi:bile acid:Na+ symporter, BASS family